MKFVIFVVFYVICSKVGYFLDRPCICHIAGKQENTTWQITD